MHYVLIFITSKYTHVRPCVNMLPPCQLYHGQMFVHLYDRCTVHTQGVGWANFLYQNMQSGPIFCIKTRKLACAKVMLLYNVHRLAYKKKFLLLNIRGKVRTYFLSINQLRHLNKKKWKHFLDIFVKNSQQFHTN